MERKINWLSSFVELIIVIIGITIAFWLNNLAEASKERELEQVFLSELRADFVKDSTRLEYYITINEEKIKTLSNAIEIISADSKKKRLDELAGLVLQIGNMNFFTPENFTATSLLQSGDIKYVRNPEIKKELLRLLRIYQQIETAQRNLLQGLDSEYFPSVISKVDMITGEIIERDFFYSLHVKNYIGFTINDTNHHVILYKNAIKQIERLMKLM